MILLNCIVVCRSLNIADDTKCYWESVLVVHHRKFRPDVVCSVNPFGGPECGLHLVPLADGPLLVLSVAVVFILGRSSKRVVVTVNMTILVLHVGILLDGLDGLLIAQPLWHASLSERRQPCGRACCPHRCAGSSDACCIPALSCPREDCRQASPSGWGLLNPERDS